MVAMAVLVVGIATAITNSPKPPPKTSNEEYQAKLKSIALPGLRVGKSANRGHQQIILSLIAITDDEDKLEEICAKALKYRDTLLNKFQKTAIAHDTKGGIRRQSCHDGLNHNHYSECPRQRNGNRCSVSL